jgi:acyl transferase domain-containing protein
MGEVAAACVAGVLTLEEAVDVIVTRSRLLKRLSGTGGMAIVGLSAADTTSLLTRLGSGAVLAASNSPRASVVSGVSEDLARLLVDLEREGVYGSAVNVDVPSHGPLTWSLCDELRRQLEHIRPRAGTVPLISTVSAGPICGTELTAEYWAKNLREPVRFAESVEHLTSAGHRLFLEIGFHPVLANSIQQGLVHLGMEGRVLSSLRRDEAASLSMFRALGEMYTSGLRIDWRRVYQPPAYPVRLPPYPWERVRYWMEEDGTEPRHAAHRREGNPLLGVRTDLAQSPGTLVWHAEVAPARTGFLRDHRVNGVVVLPLAAYVDLALSAAHGAGLATATEVQDLAIDEPMVFEGDEVRAIQVVVTTRREAGALFEVFSRSANGAAGTWTRHASALLAEATEPEASPLILTEVEARCPITLSTSEFYRLLSAHGLHYGPSMRPVGNIHCGPGETLGRISLGSEQRTRPQGTVSTPRCWTVPSNSSAPPSPSSHRPLSGRSGCQQAAAGSGPLPHPVRPCGDISACRRPHLARMLRSRRPFGWWTIVARV